MKPFASAAVVVLGIVALAHLYRLAQPFEIIVAGSEIPQWVSAAGLIVAGGISIMLWRESRAST